MVKVATVTAADPVSGVASFAVARVGTGDRIYTITATATDVAGNTSVASATCVVPRSQ